MPPKRKSSDTAAGASFYQLPGLTASKRRLVVDEIIDGVPMTRTSTNMSDRSTRNLTSPSLENITTKFDGLAAPFANSTLTTPITPEPIHVIVPPPPQFNDLAERPRTYLIIGASRGIGLEFARQLLAQRNQVIAVVRDPNTASQLWQATGNLVSRPGSCTIEQCDVADQAQIELFMSRMRIFVERGGYIDTVIVNAGILQYEQGLGAMQVDFDVLERHLRINCIGNIVLARQLLMLNELPSVIQRREVSLIERDDGFNEVVGKQVMFISSDSGSMADFREYEDGFAAYGASKVALNMMIRHMAAELRKRATRKEEAARKDWQSQDAVSPWEKDICILAMHPGEVSTDMANIQIDWDVEGVISAEESVRDMLKVIEDKGSDQSGTFWRWDGTQHPW